MENNLPKIVAKKKKRLGRGYGSGKGGHTASRGQKGQKSRRKINILFEGVKMKKSLLRRLPQLRGKEKFKSRERAVVLGVDSLNVFKVDSKVDEKALIKEGLVSESEVLKRGVKILARGKISKKLTVLVPTSLSAAKMIKKAGGKVEK